MATDKRDEARTTLNDLIAAIGRDETFSGMETEFGTKSFSSIADKEMNRVIAWAKKRRGGKAKINTAAIYARFNKHKAGAPVKVIADD